MQFPYRMRQFWLALQAAPTDEDLEQAREILSPPLMSLFLQMQASEQAHSLQVLRRLIADGATHPDLLVAALLHDVGKSHCPLRLWERVLIVIAKTLFPKKVEQWGRCASGGWKKAFTVAQQHPQWGAEMASRAGAAPLAIQLILRHQETIVSEPVLIEDRLLYQLQSMDDLS